MQSTPGKHNSQNKRFLPKNIPLSLLILLLRCFSYLPLPVIHIVGSIFGEILYWTYESRRRVTIKNLASCFPHHSAGKTRKLARGHFRVMTIGLMVMAVAWWASPARLERLTVFKNKAVLDKLLDENKNIIFLAPHFISLEFFGIYLSNLLQVTSMYQKHKNPVLEQFMFSRRTRFDSRIYDYKDTATSLIKSIRKGTPFYYLPDQDPGQNKGVFADFYNIKTATYPALNRMSRLGNAKVIPCMARLRKFGKGFEIILDEPMENYPTGNDVDDATAMNRAIEKLISYAPEQYFWSHKRFKTRPPGEPPFY